MHPKICDKQKRCCELEMAANLVRVRKFAILYRKLGVRRISQFAQKFANFFRGYFSYKKRRFQKNSKIFNKNFELKFDLENFLAIFFLSVIFYLVSSQFFKKFDSLEVRPLKFDSTRVRLLEVRFDSSSQKVGSKPSLL